MQTEKKYSQGGLEDDLLLLLYVKWDSGTPRTTREEARLINPAKYTSEHPPTPSLARLCQKGLARSLSEDSYEITDQRRVAVHGLLVLPGGLDRLREMRDKLLKTGKGTTDRRSPGETKTLVTSNVPKRPSAASMAGSMDGQIFEILHGVAEPLKVSLGEAIADARTAKKQDVCNHLKTLQKDGNTYCANCRVRIPQVVELK